jgi:hypothetical protein
MSEAYVIAAETISDGHRVPAQRSAPVATKLVGAAATLGGNAPGDGSKFAHWNAA